MNTHRRNSNPSLSARVRRTLRDLAVIQRTLLDNCEPESDKPQAPSPLLDLELAAELKSVVDGLRRLLWAYIQALSAKSGRQPHEILEWYKMEIAVDMLRSVRQRRPATTEDDPALNSLNQIISNALTVTSLHLDKHI